MKALLDAILRHGPSPIGDENRPLQLQVTTLDYSDFLGRIIIGRVHNGVISSGQRAILIKEDGKLKQGRISKLMGFEGNVLKSALKLKSLIHYLNNSHFTNING